MKDIYFLNYLSGPQLPLTIVGVTAIHSLDMAFIVSISASDVTYPKHD